MVATYSLCCMNQWICLFSLLSSFITWRISAGKRTIEDYLKNERETARNWIGTFLCSLIAALSVCDLYIYRGNLTFVIDGEEVKASSQQWVKVMSCVWSCVGACILMLIMIHFWVNPWYWCGIRFDGRFIEGLVLLVLIAVWFWAILEFTQVSAPINGPSNAYFSIWGAFFFSILTFGTWLKENRNIVQNAVPRRDHSQSSSGRMMESEHMPGRASNVSTGSIYKSTQRES